MTTLAAARSAAAATAMLESLKALHRAQLAYYVADTAASEARKAASKAEEAFHKAIRQAEAAKDTYLDALAIEDGIINPEGETK